ncbi:MAG: 3-keto-5-aminohexanoate cleavage protein [Burkholderiales bacterium]
MARPVIISCAVTGGSGAAAKKSQYVPITPEQIANECIAAAKAGANIVHIHVREPSTGNGSMELKYYREVVDRIRNSKVEVLINLTTGTGGMFMPSKENPKVATPDSNITHPEARVAHVLELKPDVCSLDVATMNMSNTVFMNVPPHLDKMAEMIRSAGVKPELEVFDHGHLRLAADMVKRGLIKDPPLFQLCLGIAWGAPADTETMTLMRSQLPEGAVWAAFGISRHEFPMAAQAVILGGHVRVGLEDNLYISQGKLSPGNAPLVERAVQIIEAVGERCATVAETRQILGL